MIKLVIRFINFILIIIYNYFIVCFAVIVILSLRNFAMLSKFKFIFLIENFIYLPRL